MAKVPDRYLEIDEWKIIEEGFHADKSRVSESLFALGNEHQGLRGSFDEGYSGSSLIGCYVNSIYEERYLREPTHYKGISNRINFMVNTANWLYTRIEIDGETLDLNRSQFSEFRRELDFKTGELRREFVWQTKGGKALRLVFSRFLSMQTKEYGFQRIAITPLNFSGDVTLTLGIDFSLEHAMYGENYWSCPTKGENAILGVSRSIKHKLFAGYRILAGMQGDAEAINSDQFIGQRFTVSLTQDVEHVIDRVNVLYTSRDPQESAESAWSVGMAMLYQTAAINYDDCLCDNAAYWRKFWDQSDIIIEGDPLTQQGIRFSIFQLQQTYRGVVSGANIGAKGLTGEVYNGNAFWDTEAYCLPFYLFSNPAAAKALIDYRYKTLPQALERARDLDCEGACFPIATIDGTEACTLWQHASLQFQPTTAVAFAIAHYANVTQDTDFLYGEGAELLIHICRFLASRGAWSGRTGKFGYYGVMGPDEFQMMVNNNCYTNYMAQQTFQFAAKTLRQMSVDQPAQYNALITQLGSGSDEIAKWEHIAANMNIPRDAETGVYEQHEGFFDLPHIDVDAIPVEDFPLYHHWSYDRIYRNDMIKQPDVLMFMLLYSQKFSLAEKEANYAYYEPRCIHESSLSPSVHSILAAELGRHEEAASFFEFATRIDLDNYNRNTGEGVHLTSVAAAWMNIVYGFGGMRSDGDVLLFNPTIPAHWTSYSFQIVYRGSQVRVTVNQTEAQIMLTHGSPITISVRGNVQELNTQGLTIEMVGQPI